MSLELESLLPYPNSCRGTSPHQQGRDTKLAMLSCGGIEVSNDRLDIMVLPDEHCSWVSNDAAGWAELVEQLRGSSITAIGVEASGGYERGVVRALLAAGMSVRQINPFKLREFAKASGTLAKNDRLDARMIASFVAIMPTRPAQRQAPMIEQLAAMLTVRRQLRDHKVATENASRLLEGALLQRPSRRRIVCIPEECWRCAESDGLGGLEVDDHLDFGRKLDRQLTGLGPFEDFVDVRGGAAVVLTQIDAVADHGTGLGIFACARDPRQPGGSRQSRNSMSLAIK